MALKTLSILAILALSSLFHVSAAFGGRKALAPAPSPDNGVEADGTGLSPVPADLGFTIMNATDPKVIGLATYAIDEYNKANNTKLVFSQVLEAISTAAAGANDTEYGLVVLANDGKDLSSYYVKITVVNDVKKVTSFSRYE